MSIKIAEKKLNDIRRKIDTLNASKISDALECIADAKKWYMSVDGNTESKFNEMVQSELKKQKVVKRLDL